MKRGRDDEKITLTGPMFPRLHVNDADKGGPRAPPRNKMALYEQLSIPSQRFSRPVMQQCAPCSSQGPDSEGNSFFFHQVARGHQLTKHYSPYSDMSIPLQQVEQRKKLDEEDYTVPIFIQGQECNRSNNDVGPGRSSNVTYLNHPLKFHKAKETAEHRSQSGINQPTENSKDFVGAKISAVPVSAQNMNVRTETSAESQQSGEGNNITAVVTRNSSNLHKASYLEKQNGLHDHLDGVESRDGECRPLQNEILEKADSVSETSILDSVSGHDITADDVVAIIGQKHFWKARKAIVNQRRLFAVQLFELHRLIKVQKLIAASPNLLLEDAAYLGKALKAALPGKNLPLDFTSIKSLPIISNQKINSEKTSHQKEVSAENSISAQKGPIPSSTNQPSNGNSMPLTREANARPWHLNNQQQGHQWLIPVMSPSEGLLYKPYPAPAPGFVSGSIHIPAYGIPPFPPFPHNYFPYGMPMMNTSGTISGSSVDQVNPPALPNPNPPRTNTFQDSSNIEVQTSTASCPSERQQSSKVANTCTDVLPLFPMSPVNNHSQPSRVIKVVPHNATSVSASVARIIRSIEEERNKTL